MGLIKALIGSVGGVLADQWKEFFVCESLTADVLMCKGEKRVTGRSSNTRGSDNLISNGSGIVVNEGQCMIIVEQGKIVEFCAEPGQFTWDSSTEPSLFTGKFGTSLIETFKLIGKRFTYGGDTGKDQRVYYFNTKEIVGNKFGTANPVPFRVVDSRINLDIDVSLRCNGVYSYKISDPLKFYSVVAGNVSGEYTRDLLDPQLKPEFLNALQPALAVLSSLEIRPHQIISHNAELGDAMKTALASDWGDRGLEVAKVAVASITLTEEDQELIKQAQKAAMYKDPTMAAANFYGAQADAMRTAAGNSGGAAVGFMGMNMAMNAGATNPQALFEMGQKQQAEQTAAAAAGSWICPKCGKSASGNFCTKCGTAKPAEANTWTCPKCGTVNKGRFCPNCGTGKPAGVPLYQCSKCGWEPEDPANPPKFCPECGDPFDENDRK